MDNTLLKKKILLVEDEESLRDIYNRQLAISGFEATCLATGKEGLEAVVKNKYDLILLDIMLPDINGLDILKSVKQNQDQAIKSTPVILLTNLGQDQIIQDGFQLGADAYLVKASYTPEQVIDEIKNLLKM